MNKWQTLSLSILCTRIGDGLHGTPQYSSGTKYYFVNGNNLENGQIKIYPETKEVSESEYKRNFIKLDDNSLLIGINGTLGNMAFYRNEQIMLGKSSAYLNFKTDINTFYYYYFQLPEVQKYFYSVATGSTIKNLSLTSLKAFTVPVPEKEEYRKIAGVLSALDDKIELNRRESAELEQMARTLYDYWFVQFDFPDAHGKPYKTSGGPMKHAKELNRQIPTAWEVKKLDDIISRSGTGLNPRQNFRLGQGSNYYVTIKNVENGKIILDDKCDKIDDEALNIIQKRSDLQPGDILFTSIQPVGVTYLIHEKPTNWNINESVFTIRPNYEKVTSEYLYMLLSSDEMKVYTTNSSAGSVHKGIRHAVLKDFNAVIVPREVIDIFSEKIKPILEKMYKNDQQSQNLAHLRDWLLPMLMNGQASVE